MASRPGLSAPESSVTGIASPYASRSTRTLWVAALTVGAAYGILLVVMALRLPAGAALTGQFGLQPTVKASAAVLLAGAALRHPVRRERRWLIPALVFSAAGDYLLAMPWWPPSFVLGLGAFLVAHLCFLGALLPLASRTPWRIRRAGAERRGTGRMAAAVVVCVACVALLVWFWPQLIAEGMAIPVILYMVVLAAMVCAALLAGLPTPWTALGAVCFAVSDGMIGIGKFVLRSEALAVPIWWAYAASLLLITAGFFFGRDRSASPMSACAKSASEHSATPPA